MKLTPCSWWANKYIAPQHGSAFLFIDQLNSFKVQYEQFALMPAMQFRIYL